MSCPCLDDPKSTISDIIDGMSIELADVIAINATERHLCQHGVAEWLRRTVAQFDGVNGTNGSTPLKDELMKMFNAKLH